MIQKHAAIILALMLLTTGSAGAAARGNSGSRSVHANTTGMTVISTGRPTKPFNRHQGTTVSVRSATQASFAPTAAVRSALSSAEAAPHRGNALHSARFPSTGDDYTTHSLTMQEEMMMNFINNDRAANGLPPLTPDPALCRIARIKSQDMLDNGYFAHESPVYGRASNMLKHFGYDFRGAGENIARHATVEKAQAAFMSSRGHRRNILSANWEKVGVGVVTDASGHVYATQIFVR